VVLFLAGSAAILGLTTWFYLLPALRAALAATQPAQRKQLAAVSLLVLAIVLLTIVAWLVITVGFGRFFFPRKREPQKPTTYTDAWGESGRRMPTPPPDADT
jgi:heme/copper-type cytochrome/quinol oxidase subunit 2